MVQSKIVPAISYVEKRDIHEEDMGFASAIYDLDVLDDLTIAVAIGKPKYLYSKRGVVFFPIYLVSTNDRVRGQIGVFEMRAKSADMLKFAADDFEFSEDDLGDPLLFKFATKSYLERAAAATGAATDAAAPEPPAAAEEEEEEPAAAEEEEEEEVFKIKVDKKPAEYIAPDEREYKIHHMDQIFHRNEEVHPLPELTEETEKDTQRYRTEYEEAAKTEWVEKFFHNNHYKIHRKPGDGDCFFETVRDAFFQIGLETTVEKLRKIVADAADIATLEQYLILYQNPMNAIADAKSQKKKLGREGLELKKKIEKSDAVKNMAEHQKLIDAAKKLTAKMKFLDEEIAGSQEIAREFRFMEGIDTLEKLQQIMMTKKYWADDFAILAVEKALRVKTIILSEEAYASHAPDFVLNCGQKIEGLNPFYYIMTTYSGVHYELISYKVKNILKYREIPHAVKSLILNKCMERNAGAYNEIPDFVELQRSYGAPAAATAAAAEEEQKYHTPPGTEEYYDDETQFMFYINSANAAVGKGTGETVEAKHMGEFLKLNTFNVAANKKAGTAADGWRRALDDEYIGSDAGATGGDHGTMPAAFELNGKRWAAVEIYYQAAKFRKQNPDFYHLFSLDSGSEFSNNVEYARIAGGAEGKKRVKNAVGETEVKKLREKTMKIDTDFYDGSRSRAERAAAVYAKFSQNARLKEMLLATKRALLKHFVRGRAAEPDVVLMEIRDKLKTEEEN